MATLYSLQIDVTATSR